MNTTIIEPEFSIKPKIEGWLVVYLLQIIISILFYLLIVIGILHWWDAGGIIHNDVSGYKFLLLLPGLITACIKLPISLLVLFLIIKKKQIIPRFVFMLEGICIFTRVIEIVNITMQLDSTITQILQTILYILISFTWILYFKKSIRVKNTFLK
ncbi:DUF2569 family protein [Paenibacillus sp. Soil787]|uniref:DUF2569 family protein n=1 Tax=Paenibacillus sp. Soil787 TaxID=1736411 RepID=UPI0006F6AA0F|nr:DUF2569 family protein [Paenibacillus sp. Soil787]KRF32111.1 hypothetical protein ASG93_07295 [Paenibacillus sp. Soil787]